MNLKINLDDSTYVNFNSGGILITKILIGIPVYNEQAYLSKCISSLYEFINMECQDYEISVLLVDDGSTDQSQEIYEKSLAEIYPLDYTRHSSGPLGYGRTILTLFQRAKIDYDILITFDADLQHAPFSIKDIIENFEDNSQITLVSTSRYLSYRFWKQNTKVPIDRYITNMLMTKTINECFNLDLTDCFCGLKGYKTEILPTNLDETGYAFPLVFWHYVFQNRLKIKEIETPIIYRLDRRARGEWKQRLEEYYMKLETLVSSTELKRIIKQDYQKALEQMNDLINHFENSPICTYQDFIKRNQTDHQ
ncbi:MAG: glycosyltransferase family 2 protein [Candidatus Heimdallarchaeota archaeon]|nr:MAG: glycosyltransferase family 2 protein [Candidatus Heimdallarchaeota archaeon]